MQKQLEGTQKYITIGDRAAQATHNYCGCTYNCVSPAEYKYQAIKPSNPFTNVCWVSVLTTFSAPPQTLAASVFFCPLQKRRNDG